MRNVLYVVGLLLIASIDAQANCRVERTCDKNAKDCKTVQKCDSTPLLPKDLAPEPARRPASVELGPLNGMQLLPAGSARCEYMQLSGRWQYVCL